MNKYIINNSTIALIPIKKNMTKVLEINSSFFINESAMKIIENSCEYFGSSYNGRHIGTKILTGINYKSPIIIEESKNIIYFPTMSPRDNNCAWLSLNHINKYINKNGKIEVLFENGSKYIFDMSYGSFDNQYLRATKLESILRKRKI